MKIIALILSLLVFANLSLDLIDGETKEQSDVKATNDAAINLPKPLSDILLPIETKWQTVQAQKSVADKKESNEPQGNKRNFNIGDNSYQLLGIFKEQQNNFVLLKDSKNKLIKLKQHDVLPGGYSLVEINANIIAFVTNNERVEYKLFETKSHAKN